jgi:predicted amidohydrolase
MSIDGVLQGRAAGGSFHVVELAAELLQLCRKGADALRALLLDPQWTATRTRIRREAAETVRDRGQLDGSDAHQLASIVAQRAGAPDVLVARAVAEGLDAGAGQFFADWFHGRLLDLSPNDPFPVAENNVRRWVTTSTGNPDTRSEALDRLPRLRLAPADLRGLRVSMRWADAPLAELEHVERFGVGVVSDPDVFNAFTWERYSIDAQGLFFDVRPRDPAALTDRIRAVVETAERRAVDLLLLPELCVTAEMHASLIAAGTFDRLPFVVAGSHHNPPGVGPGHNEATLFVRGHPIASHRKFRPVILPDRYDDAGCACEVIRQEHLRVDESRISVLVTGDWSVATLICKDAIENAVQDLLRELAVQLVLVPAMSPTTEDFADLARLLGRDPQSYTLIANTGETVAIVGTPATANRSRSYKYSGETLLVFDRNGDLIRD